MDILNNCSRIWVKLELSIFIYIENLITAASFKESLTKMGFFFWVSKHKAVHLFYPIHKKTQTCLKRQHTLDRRRIYLVNTKLASNHCSAFVKAASNVQLKSQRSFYICPNIEQNTRFKRGLYLQHAKSNNTFWFDQHPTNHRITITVVHLLYSLLIVFC